MGSTESIRPGDCYIKTGMPKSRWVVERVLDLPGVPPHVRLIERGGNNRTITIAARELGDSRKFSRVGDG